LFDAIGDRIAEKSTTTDSQVSTTVAPVSDVVNRDNKIEVEDLRKYSDTIKKVEVFKEPNYIAFRVEYVDDEARSEAHYADNLWDRQVIPMLCFYIDNGLQVKCPGKFEFIKDTPSVEYRFTDDKNFVSALYITDGIVTDLGSLLNNKFNLYLEHISKEGVGRTLAGTYSQTVEQFNQLYAPTPMDIEILSDGIKKVETTVCDDFIWVDIYYVDEAAYKADNADLEKNFVVFGFEKGGNKYKRDFVITEYPNLYMNRCVFDAYAIKDLGEDMMVEDITVKELFDEYSISVWATDYTTDKDLLAINGGNDVHDEIEEENFGEFENVEIE
jgi:hypothetical protein